MLSSLYDDSYSNDTRFGQIFQLMWVNKCLLKKDSVTHFSMTVFFTGLKLLSLGIFYLVYLFDFFPVTSSYGGKEFRSSVEQCCQNVGGERFRTFLACS